MEKRGHSLWTSHQAYINLDKLFQHKDTSACFRIAITWREGNCNGNKPPLVYLPRLDISHERPFTFRVWFGEKNTAPLIGMDHRAEYDYEKEIWSWACGTGNVGRTSPCMWRSR